MLSRPRKNEDWKSLMTKPSHLIFQWLQIDVQVLMLVVTQHQRKTETAVAEGTCAWSQPVEFPQWWALTKNGRQHCHALDISIHKLPHILVRLTRLEICFSFFSGVLPLVCTLDSLKVLYRYLKKWELREELIDTQKIYFLFTMHISGKWTCSWLTVGGKLKKKKKRLRGGKRHKKTSSVFWLLHSWFQNKEGKKEKSIALFQPPAFQKPSCTYEESLHETFL